MDLGDIEIDIRPSEPERFTTPQAENENQHVGRIQRVLVAPSRLQESAGLLDRPPLPLWPAGIGEPHDGGDIAWKQLFGHSVGERGAEHIAGRGDGAW